MKTNLVLSMVAFALYGCASTSFKPTIAKFDDQFADQSALEEKANELSNDSVADIKVITGTLPAGVRLMGDRIEADPSSNYEVIAKIATQTNGKISPHSSWNTTPYYFYPFAEDESWRKPYCHWQVPLMWVTLGIWAIVPVNYPCWTVDTEKQADINNRKMRILSALKKGVKAVGGDTLVFLGEKGTTVMNSSSTRVGNTPISVGTSVGSEMPWTSGAAYALRTKKSVPAPAVHSQRK